MNGRNSRLGIASRAVVGPLALTIWLTLAPRGAEAGILRDVLVSVGLAKPKPDVSGAAAGKPIFPRQGYACCALHYDGDWINDGNYAELPMIAAGTPIEVLGYGRHRAFVKINGKPMRLGHDYGRNEESLDVWVNKIVVNEDPRGRIASYSEAIQTAIGLGKVMVGMTRDEAIAAIGYPLTSENASLDASVWRIWRSTRGEYQLNFGLNGRVTAVTGDDSVTSQVIYRPGR